MEGLLTLSEGIHCKSDILGKIIGTTIMNLPVTLHFPQLPEVNDENPEIGINNPLKPPELSTNWKRGDEELFWGYLTSYQNKDCVIELLGISIDCEDQTKERIEGLYRETQFWEENFLNYLIVATKQNTKRNKNLKIQSKFHFEILDSSYNPKYMVNPIVITIPSEEEFATAKQVSDAIHFAESGKELLSEYQLLLSAYMARRNNQNRQAIIDASAAVEICLVSYINKRMGELNLNSKLFLDKFRSLGDRFDLVKDLDKTLPDDDYQKIIVKPRNDIAHNKNTIPSDEVTDKLITCVESCLNHFYESYY